MSAPPSRVEHAVFAVFELARAFRSKKPISAQKIAAKYRVSERSLALILQDLKKAKLVSTVRGSLGGFRLVPAPEELTLGYVVALAESSEKRRAFSDRRVVDSLPEPAPVSPQSVKKGARKTSKIVDAPAAIASGALKPPPFDDDAAARTAFERAWREAESKRQEYLNAILFSELIKDSRVEIPLNFSI